MNKKSFTMGLGVGIILVSIIFYFLYGIESKNLLTKAELRDEEIIIRANELGLFAPIEHTDDDIITRALALGMSFASEAPETAAELPGDNTEQIETGQVETEQIETKAPAVPLPDGMIAFTIPKGSNSNEVSEILYKSGVIDDLDGFKSYVTDRNMSKNIIYGDYQLPAGADYGDILNSIARNR